MKKVLIFSILLLIGLVGSQILPGLVGPAYPDIAHVVRVLTMIALAFIMIHVGYEFEIDKSNLKQYGWDYVVAFTAASFPWVFVTLYFVFVMLPADFWADWAAWKETLLAGRFAAPTSAGVLFSMLAAAGLSATWLFRKARILAIFDDLDTVLLMIPLKMLMVGLAWQLGFIVLIMVALLILAYVFLHRWRIPVTWPWVIGYAAGIGLTSEVIYLGSKVIDESVPVHIEVLLPAFVLGCLMAYPTGSDPHTDDGREGHQEGPESPAEQRVATIISALFMVLVGLSMPDFVNAMSDEPEKQQLARQTLTASEVEAQAQAAQEIGQAQGIGTVTAAQPGLGWGMIGFHVLMVTIISNIGKMFPAFCYRKEAHWRERLAVAVGMWPRGEVGAGVLVISLSYGIGGPIVTVAMLSLALNLVLTGVFIYMVKKLLGVSQPAPA